MPSATRREQGTRSSFFRTSADSELIARARIKLQLAASTLEGILFTYSPILNVIALSTSSAASQTADYHVIPVSAVQNVTVLAAPSGEVPQISKVDTAKLKAREEERVRKLQDVEAKRGKGVSVEGQRVFDALDRMYVDTRTDRAGC